MDRTQKSETPEDLLDGDLDCAAGEGHEKWIPIEGLFHGANRNVADVPVEDFSLNFEEIKVR